MPSVEEECHLELKSHVGPRDRVCIGAEHDGLLSHYLVVVSRAVEARSPYANMPRSVVKAHFDPGRRFFRMAFEREIGPDLGKEEVRCGPRCDGSPNSKKGL